jgi:hypothetical protein
MQRFLTEMKHELSGEIGSLKQELKKDNHRLESKVDDCLMVLADHETRVSIIEQTPPADHDKRLAKVEGDVKTARWLVGTVIMGGITTAFGYLSTMFNNPGSITK